MTQGWTAGELAELLHDPGSRWAIAPRTSVMDRISKHSPGRAGLAPALMQRNARSMRQALEREEGQRARDT